jgi:hypothetical protein
VPFSPRLIYSRFDCFGFNFYEIWPSLARFPINSYSSPALFAFMLIIIETIYMYYCLPETLHLAQPTKLRTKSQSSVSRYNLSVLSYLHFAYLFFFSGMEFTLTFLTFETFNFSHMDQGKLLGFIGVSSALIQGLFVRRVSFPLTNAQVIHKILHEKTLVLLGLLSCMLGLLAISFVPSTSSKLLLYIGAACLSFTSATVVSGLTAMASFEASSGEGMGRFRGVGQLGRACGPGVAAGLYWGWGGGQAYRIGAVGVVVVGCFVGGLVKGAKKTGGDKKNA